jgi:hypothetical protein
VGVRARPVHAIIIPAMSGGAWHSCTGNGQQTEAASGISQRDQYENSAKIGSILPCQGP